MQAQSHCFTFWIIEGVGLTCTLFSVVTVSKTVGFCKLKRSAICWYARNQYSSCVYLDWKASSSILANFIPICYVVLRFIFLQLYIVIGLVIMLILFFYWFKPFQYFFTNRIIVYIKVKFFEQYWAQPHYTLR